MGQSGAGAAPAWGARRRGAGRSNARWRWRPIARTSCCWRRGSSRPAATWTRAWRSCVAPSPRTRPTCVRAFALVEELERAGQGDGDDEVTRLLDDLIARVPANLAVVVERARVAARRSDAVRARDSVMRLDADVGRLAGHRARAAAAASARRLPLTQWPDAVRSAALLRNVLARVPAFTEGLGQIRTPAELVGQPLSRFVVLAPPSARPSPPDTALSFSAEPLRAGGGAGPLAGAARRWRANRRSPPPRRPA